MSDNTFSKKLDNIIRKLSIELTVPASMTGKVPDSLYFSEAKAANSIKQLFLATIKEIVPEKRSDTPIDDVYRTDKELVDYYAEIRGHDQAISETLAKAEEKLKQ